MGNTTFLSSELKHDVFSSISVNDQFGLGLGFSLLLIGVAIILQGSVQAIKERKEKKKKGSLSYSEED